MVAAHPGQRRRVISGRLLRCIILRSFRGEPPCRQKQGTGRRRADAVDEVAPRDRPVHSERAVVGIHGRQPRSEDQGESRDSMMASRTPRPGVRHRTPRLHGIKLEHAIGAPGELEAMGDDNRRAAAHHSFVSLRDLTLGRRIERGARLVEDQDRRVRQERARRARCADARPPRASCRARRRSVDTGRADAR